MKKVEAVALAIVPPRPQWLNQAFHRPSAAIMNILDVLTPLYILIILGYLLKKYQFPNKEFWPGIEKMTYFILFPTLVFVAILKAPIDASLLAKVSMVAIIPALISGAMQFLGFLSPHISDATVTSMYQGAIRNNTSISLVIVAWLLPDHGLAYMAVIILIMVPLNNFTCILMLLRYATPHDNKSKPPSLWLGIVKNPLIIATALGFLINISGVQLPYALINTADFLGRSALPFALLAVGAGLKFGSIFTKKLAILMSSTGKLILTPAITWSLCMMLDVEPELTKVMLIFSAAPTAISSYILAKQMGGDDEGMAQIITFQTVAAAVTLPLILLLLESV